MTKLDLTHTQITDIQHIKEYMTGGHAEFTLLSLRTGIHFTYQINRNPRGNGFFVSYLTGPDNTSDYRYLGIAPNACTQIVPTKKSPNPKNSPAFQGLNWFLFQLCRQNHEALAKVEFYHTGSCSRCGRKLTTPESIERGIGPVCASRAVH